MVKGKVLRESKSDLCVHSIRLLERRVFSRAGFYSSETWFESYPDWGIRSFIQPLQVSAGIRKDS